MDLTKLITAFTNLINLIKGKQNKVIVKTSDPTSAEGSNGDICVVVDP